MPRMREGFEAGARGVPNCPEQSVPIRTTDGWTRLSDANSAVGTTDIRDHGGNHHKRLLLPLGLILDSNHTRWIGHVFGVDIHQMER